MESRILDYIVVGQGLGGTLMSYMLTQREKSHVVIDNNHHQAASLIAAGVINPITGRKYVKSWRIEDFLPFARKTYIHLGQFLDEVCHYDKLIYRGLYSIKDENTWESRKSDPIAGQYIKNDVDDSEYRDNINGVMSYGVLQQGMQVPLGKIVTTYREYLTSISRIINEKFDYSQLVIDSDHVVYKDVKARQIIFAEGYQAKYNPWFGMLGHEAAKGDVLIVKIQGRPFDNILRHKVFISPIDDEHYWVGSGYRWTFEDDAPDEEKGREIKEVLDTILNVPYEIVKHIAGIRPCVKGRRPFLGRHPQYENLILFNGLGTKGASLGPYWADHLIKHLEDNAALDIEVDIAKKF